MIRKVSWWMAGVAGLAVLPGLASAQAPKWQAEHDAGWDAYKQGQLDVAETRLRAGRPPQYQRKNTAKINAASACERLRPVLAAAPSPANAKYPIPVKSAVARIPGHVHFGHTSRSATLTPPGYQTSGNSNAGLANV